MTRVHAKAPCRVDLFGGTLDLWPLYLWFQPCTTVNLAVTVMNEATVEFHPGHTTTVDLSMDAAPKPLHTQLTWPFPLEGLTDPWKLIARAVHHFAAKAPGTYTVHCRSEAPVGSGLASSSSQMVAVMSALNKVTGSGYTHEKLQRLCRDLECQVILAPAGEQDYFPALYGGLGIVSLEVGGPAFAKISNLFSAFEEQLVVFYTGTSHHSGVTNWHIYKGIVEKEANVSVMLKELAENSTRGLAALRAGHWEPLLKHIREDWNIRRSHFPILETEIMKKAARTLENQGIQAYKACGAAAGGCMLALAPVQIRPTLFKELEKIGMQMLTAKPSQDGVILTN